VTIRALGEKRPRIAPTAWVSEAAYVVGDVEIGEGSSVWPGAVIRGDFAPIRIGAFTHIEDNCVVHTGEPLEIGDDCIVGHGVIVHGRRIGSYCLLGNNATVLDGAVIGDACTVAAGAVVLGNAVIPDESFVSGVPATHRPATAKQVASRRRVMRGDEGYALMSRLYKEAGL